MSVPVPCAYKTPPENSDTQPRLGTTGLPGKRGAQKRGFSRYVVLSKAQVTCCGEKLRFCKDALELVMAVTWGRGEVAERRG